MKAFSLAILVLLIISSVAGTAYWLYRHGTDAEKQVNIANNTKVKAEVQHAKNSVSIVDRDISYTIERLRAGSF